jgi:hypothetical protein
MRSGKGTAGRHGAGGAPPPAKEIRASGREISVNEFTFCNSECLQKPHLTIIECACFIGATAMSSSRAIRYRRLALIRARQREGAIIADEADRGVLFTANNAAALR